MEKLIIFRKRSLRFALLLFFIVWTINFSSGNNPKLSNYLINLSSVMNPENLDDVAPEMIIAGNTIHTVWIEYKYGAESPLYYCRSVDLGKTWETPKLILKLKDSQYVRGSSARKLAVDGSNVYIGVCDYNYSDNGTGRIFFSLSANGGTSFTAARELVTTGGGYNAITRSSIKAAGGKVAIAYLGSGAKSGLRMLYSGNGGTAFTDTQISTEPTDLSDFWYDGSLMVVIHEYAYYYYGLNVGRVYASVSSNNGSSFVTNKISPTYLEQTTTRERSRCYHDVHYAPKIAKSGNNLHVIFIGYSDKATWTILYARSTDNGLTFEKAKDINEGVLAEAAIQGGQEAVAARGSMVYLTYLSTAGKAIFLQSEDNGNSFTKARNILPDGYAYVETTWYPALVTDPNDATGKTVYLTGNAMYSCLSTDGGKNFSRFTLGAPFLSRNISYMVADMAIDSKGTKHWISNAKWWDGTDQDIFYRYIGNEPDPGTKNKALKIETSYSPFKAELVIVPSSPTLNFDSVMTAEAWVKFDLTPNDGGNIVGKVNGADSYDYAPNGYQICFRKDKGKMCINTGIETDKGDFVNWCDCNIGDTLWHHVAFTYDARPAAGLRNFKTYVDGLLKAEQTVTGKIIQGNGLLMIGSRSAFYGSTKYQVDNLRLWNRALPQSELLQNQVKTFTGKENGLKMFLNFDDTFKDISGNGNDAVALYLGELKSSNFNPPVPDFDLYQNINQISLTNKTRNGKTYQWSFGDGAVSDKGNPVYSYPKPGEYSVTLEAMNENSKTALIKNATVAGLDHVEPNKAGNYGYSSIAVYGGGLTVTGTTIILRKTGVSEIVGENIYSPDTGVLSAEFPLGDASLGKWDVVVKKGTTEQVLKEAFQIVQAVMPATWVSFSGRGAVLINRWQTYSINYGNNGNIDAYGVPVYLAITDDKDVEVEFVDFEMKAPDYAVSQGIAKQVTDMGSFFTTNIVQGEQFKAKVYPILIPVIPANSTSSIHIRLKSPANFKVRILSGPPMLERVSASSGSTTKSASVNTKRLLSTAQCLFAAVLQEAFDVVVTTTLDELKRAYACVYKSGSWVWETGQQIKGRKATFGNVVWNLSFVGAECAVALGPWSEGARLAAGILVSGVKNIYAARDCIKSGEFQGDIAWLIYALFSFDPNEMVGPAGYSDQHWIQKNNAVPYTIFFENKSTATAPAHDVFVTDTLDTKKFDLKEFGFDAAGFGDTTLFPNGKKLKQFSIDVNLNPKKNLITRITGKLDSITGVIRWEFLSLNPTTMMPEEDPLNGFLPPNNASRQGEGFVSFSVGLKSDLKTNAVIKNRASIVFDSNKPILTNEYINTLDTDRPQSNVLALPAKTKDGLFKINWTGTDTGSGVRNYSVWVLDNDSTLSPWLLNTTKTSDDFIPKLNHTYKFYSTCADNVNLIEDAPNVYDTQTTITVGVHDLEWIEGELTVYPNPARNVLKISLNNPAFGMYVVELVGMNGITYHSQIYDNFSLGRGVMVDLDNCSPGQYMVRVIVGNKNFSRKILIN